jgi:murein DD-endopeptidase MepM/ murein hydrolase activator NlpD
MCCLKLTAVSRPHPAGFCAGGELAARCGAGHGAGLNRYPSPAPISPGGRGPDCDQLRLAAHPTEDRLIFNSGVTLATVPGADILAAGPGTVAYVGPHETLGTLVVVNHAQGMQTRYGQVTGVTVAVGDTVTAGTAIAQMPADTPETPAYFYFEVRTNSPLGWVARNPGDYLPELAVQ